MSDNLTSYKGCPICDSTRSNIFTGNYKIDCLKCGKFNIEANAINDWLLANVPEQRKKAAIQYINENKVLIKTKDIQKFYEGLYPDLFKKD